MYKKYAVNINLVGVIAVLLLFSFQRKKQKVFVIGDSISMQYGPYLKKSLEGFYTYDRKRGKGQTPEDLDNPVGANGGDSGMVLTYLRELSARQGFHTDILLLNCGLHDIKTQRQTNERQIEPETYLNNLRQIVKLTKKMKVKLVWVRTTPVVDSIHNSKAGFNRYAKDVNIYNNIADQVMQDQKIPVIDLHGFTAKLGEGVYMDHVHFTEKTREKQADFIAGYLTGLL